MKFKQNKHDKHIDSPDEQKRSWPRLIFKSIKNLFLFFLAFCFISGFFVLGFGSGYFASLIKDEPIRDYETMKKDINDYEKTSKLYFAGDQYFEDVSSDIHREQIKLDKVPEVLKNAVLATEDEDFYNHKGIEPKAIMRAGIQEVTHADIRTGGSTLTQQLIKNQILTNEVSFDRKAKEILLALRVENFFSKDEILQAYLNVIPYGREASGRNIAGIKTAANGVFGIEPKKLNLPQAAYLAGLPQSPTYYTPYLQNGEIKSKEDLEPGIKRMKYVLKRMRHVGFISEKEYTEALDYDITKDFEKKSNLPNEKYPTLVYEAETRARDILMEQFAKEDKLSMKKLKDDKKLYEKYYKKADVALRREGYQIHTTINKKMFNKMQKVAKDYKYYGPDKPETVKDEKTGKNKEVKESIQVGSILIENKTGRIISFVPSRGFSEENELNYATRTHRPNGSTMKPLLDYAPAMEKGYLQPGDTVADVPTSFDGWKPENYGSGTHGLVSAREALKNSYNIPAAGIYVDMLKKGDTPSKDYLEKMGINNLKEEDHTNASMSLGQPSRGITVEDNTNAFATFANDGKFVDGYMIEKILDNEGKTVYEHKPDSVKVFSPQTSYLTLDMMRDVIKSGTGSYLNSQLKYSDVDWAGKTGTSQNWEDAWFVASNPNVTFGT
ncbi:MAG TPA: penicillin-binding protein, partial [Candidatus Avamphibacillus intestinigallinarum]|nr:penicillin-binding protein [Candidatus Avamphibacillus intestinigallinarum]